MENGEAKNLSLRSSPHIPVPQRLPVPKSPCASFLKAPHSKRNGKTPFGLKILTLALLLALFSRRRPAAEAEPEEPQRVVPRSAWITWGDGAFAQAGPSFSPGFGAALLRTGTALPYLSLGAGFRLYPPSGFRFLAVRPHGLWGGGCFPWGPARTGSGTCRGHWDWNWPRTRSTHTWPGNFHTG